MTKCLAGLPIVLLRCNILSRLLILRLFFSKKNLTQRDLDKMYRNDYLQGGYEYPNQLLVITICFPYACISPVILPVGALYFLGSFIVYKKQILLVYTPDYESGGTMFPGVCHRTLIGLITGQVTLIGYTLVREGFYQFVALLPLPFLTFLMMKSFQWRYEEPGAQLSLEKAIKLDRDSIVSVHFQEDMFEQPVLREGNASPQPFRRVNTRTVRGGGSHGAHFSGGGSSGSASLLSSHQQRSDIGVLHDDIGKIV